VIWNKIDFIKFRLEVDFSVMIATPETKQITIVLITLLVYNIYYHYEESGKPEKLEINGTHQLLVYADIGWKRTD
jgi:hypothetical protein